MCNDELFLSWRIKYPMWCNLCSDAMIREREQRIARGEDTEWTDSEIKWHGSEAEAAEVVVYHSAILRNKRLLMTYM